MISLSRREALLVIGTERVHRVLFSLSLCVSFAFVMVAIGRVDMASPLIWSKDVLDLEIADFLDSCSRHGTSLLLNEFFLSVAVTDPRIVWCLTQPVARAQ
jgi:hypothetical protein